MGQTIPPLGDPHREVQSLLPWYVTGRLDAEERARVEAHLRLCPQCQADEKFERRLEAQLAGLPVRVDQTWPRLRRSLGSAGAPPRSPQTLWARIALRWDASPAWVRWAVAAPIIALLVLALAWPPSPPRPVRARPKPATPSARALPATAQMVVIFKPDAREAEIRDSLRTLHARLVDGPTASDGYVLEAPAAERAADIAALRQRPFVVLAEPMEAAAQ